MTALMLLVALSVPGGRGDLMLRLWRRFPECRGVATGAYAGDGAAFLCRARVSAGAVGGFLLTEKDRGENWGDLVACGASCRAGRFDASAGWLRASLGSGLVFSNASSWGAEAAGLDARPPGREGRLATATGASTCEGEPLTGVSISSEIGDLTISGLQSWSRIDPSGDGLHRTDSERASRGSIHETVSAVRGVFGLAGLSLMRRSADGEETLRAGADFGIDLGGQLLSGEAAVESDTASSCASWLALSRAADRFRFCVAAFHTPGEFGEERSSSPSGLDCDFGCGFAIRWRPSTGWLGALSISGGEAGGESGQRGNLEVSRRVSPNLEFLGGARAFLAEGGSSWRETLRISWKVSPATSLSLKFQSTSASEGDSGECGGAVEAQLRLSPIRALSTAVGCAAFSTAGYDSRAYCGELGFPGETGSCAVWGRGFLLQGSAAFSLGGGAQIRARFSRLSRENVESLGSGLEETRGPVRTEAGVQVELPLGS